MSVTNLIVKTKSGPVKGLKKETDIGKEYYSFQHIPYAKQPVGQLRFKDPEPVEPWTEVVDATKEGPPAYSYDMFLPSGAAFVGGDNCLALNVYTPNLTPTKSLPVLVWIHGGGFVNGSSSTIFYGPDFLVEKDVILVSINYRLGIFGFLSLNDPKVGIPGNAGLKDQTMALKWIKANIEHFGGDPKNITIAGESAGGASIHYHLISELSKGLFQKAIVQSGVALNPWAMAPSNYKEYLNKLASLLGLGDNVDDVTLYETLLGYDPIKLLELDLTLLSADDKSFRSVLMSPFLPQVEPYVSDMCFLPKHPLELGRHAWSKDIDILIGGCADEGLIMSFFPLTEDQKSKLAQDYKLLVPLDIKQNIEEKGKILKELYYGSEVPNVDNYKNFINYSGEKLFWHGICRAIKQRQISNGVGKTYLYWLSVEPSQDKTEYYKFARDLTKIEQMSGTNHGDDIHLIFKASFVPRYVKGDDNFDVQQRFLETYTNFLKNGLPGDTWQPTSKGKCVPLKCLIMDRNRWEMADLPINDKIKVWDSLYEKDLY